MTGGVSFRGFVEELTAQAEKAEASEAPVLEEDSDGVRLMTVHGAKGLEFPVVILADLTANLCAREPDQYVDGAKRVSATRLLRCAPWELLDHEADEAARERAEGVRVAYVAATRARDLLVVPACGDEPFPQDNWLSPLNKALYPSRENWRKSRPAPGCPEFGAASVVARPMDYDREAEFSVRPGLIAPQQGSHEVVWWDPSKLKLGEEGDHGLRQEELLKDDGGASSAAYQAWREQRAKIDRRRLAPGIRRVPREPGCRCSSRSGRRRNRSGESRPHGRPHWTPFRHAGPRRPARRSAGREPRHDPPMGAAQRTHCGRAPGRNRGCLLPRGGRARSSASRSRARSRAQASRVSRDAARGRRTAHGRHHRSGVRRGRRLDRSSTSRPTPIFPAAATAYQRQLQWYASALSRLTGLPARAYLLGV